MAKVTRCKVGRYPVTARRFESSLCHQTVFRRREDEETGD